MSRQNRIDIPNTIYHVINRGNKKSDIFKDEKDYFVFLKYLGETQKEKSFLLYSYCLMPNHFHLLIETLETPLSKIMQKLLTTYAIYFNARYKQTGHVFQSRYKSKICEKEDYLFRLVHYINLNPVKAKLVNRPEDYKWSSCLCYTGKITNNMLALEKLFSYMGYDNLEQGYKSYAAILQEEVLPEHYSRTNRLIMTGKANITKQFFNFKQLSLYEIAQEISTKNEISVKTLLSKNRVHKTDYARRLFCREAVNKHGYMLKEVANFLEREISVIYKHMKD